MEPSVKLLIERLSKRRSNEMVYFLKYKDEQLHELMMISSGKIMEIDYLIRELKNLNINLTKNKNYKS
jgi:hypothetical protein